MPNRGYYWNWLDHKDEIFAIAEEVDVYNYVTLASRFGCPLSSLKSAARTHGWRGELKKRFSQSSPPPDLRHDVLSEEGRANFAQEAENKFLKKELKRLQKAVVEQEDLFERMTNAAAQPRPVPAFNRTRSSGHRRRDVLLHLSDLHYGEEVKPEDTPGGINIFNADIFKKRMERYVDGVCGSLEDFAAGHTLENLVLACGGDFVTGDNIFPHQAWTLDRHPVQQVLELCDILVAAITQIMQVAYESIGMHSTHVFCVPGNHGKMQGTKRSGGQPNTYSWDWLLYQMLQRSLQEYPIEQFEIEPAGSLYFGCKDHVFQLAHGHEVRGALSISFYGVGRFDARSIRTNRVMPDAILLGHYHQQASIPIGYGEALHSGSFLGANNLTPFTGASPASQNVYLISSDFGPAQRSIIQLQTKEERDLKPEVHEIGITPRAKSGSSK